jgi:glycogen operon protein
MEQKIPAMNPATSPEAVSVGRSNPLGAYCQDNEINWFDWTLPVRHADVHRFLKLLIVRRLMRSVEHERRRVSLNEMLRVAKKSWHGVKLGQPDWSPSSHSLAFSADLANNELTLHLIFNAYWELLDFELPVLTNGGVWRRWIDTALPPPQEIVEWQTAQPFSGTTYHAGPRSVVVLASGSAFETSLTAPAPQQNRITS